MTKKLHFISTRGVPGSEGAKPKTFEDVLLAGLAPDGGLYVPESWPRFSTEELEEMAGQPYAEIALRVMWPFVAGSIEEDVFRQILHDVYVAGNFNHACVAPLNQLSSKIWMMELHRGPTLAFKDVALQLLGRLFDEVLKRKKQRITIVGATSGDTGSAAIEGCKSCDNVDIFILHPQGRVSDVQRRQMTTVKADNVFNIALKGTFDDCQNMVKAMFGDANFRSTVNLSAINSINWARIMAQIVYYFTTAIALGAPHRKVSFSVPTGNFGNVYAAYVARKMGLPIDMLAISTNRNDILTRFFESGEMSMRDVEKSLSPSMDIQISSNFERYLFDLVGRDAGKIVSLMNMFKSTGAFSLGGDLVTRAQEEFRAYRCSDEETLAIIKGCYQETAEIIDPHTAVALKASLTMAKETKNACGPFVSLACAHAAKFPDSVEKAIGIHPDLPPRLADLHERTEYVQPLSNDLKIVQKFVCDHAHITKGRKA